MSSGLVFLSASAFVAFVLVALGLLQCSSIAYALVKRALAYPRLPIFVELARAGGRARTAIGRLGRVVGYVERTSRALDRLDAARERSVRSGGELVTTFRVATESLLRRRP